MAARVQKGVHPKDFEHSRQIFESRTTVRKVDSGGEKLKKKTLKMIIIMTEIDATNLVVCQLPEW